VTNAAKKLKASLTPAGNAQANQKKLCRRPKRNSFDGFIVSLLELSRI
jgi:hypothetical protein